MSERPVRVRICGLKEPAEVAAAEVAGADAVGFFVEHPVPVPWNLSVERAAELVAGASPFLATVALVRGAVDHVIAVARAVRPRLLELHGEETADEVREVCRALETTGTRVIKALGIEAGRGMALFADPDPLRAAADLAATGIVALALDSRTASDPAGVRTPLDWSLAARMRKAIRIPLILAGGLHPENVGHAVVVVKPYAVDVINGVETAPRSDQGAWMRAFVGAAKGLK